jgi:hypothetical protein
MPVINPEEVHKVADDIAKGKVDITSPYANESSSLTKGSKVKVLNAVTSDDKQATIDAGSVQALTTFSKLPSTVKQALMSAINPENIPNANAIAVKVNDKWYVENDTTYFVNESINESVESDNIINTLQLIDVKLELFHHNTKSFSQHKAFDDIYEAFDWYKDDLIEKIIGYTGDRYTSVKVDATYSDSTGLEIVNDLQNLSQTLATFAETNKYADLKNISDSLSGLSAKLNYLLTLNESALKSAYWVNVVNKSDAVWSSIEDNAELNTLADAHSFGQKHCTKDDSWYQVFDSKTDKELFSERTKLVNGKYVTNYLKA